MVYMLSELHGCTLMDFDIGSKSFPDNFHGKNGLHHAQPNFVSRWKPNNIKASEYDEFHQEFQQLILFSELDHSRGSLEVEKRHAEPFYCLINYFGH